MTDARTSTQSAEAAVAGRGPTRRRLLRSVLGGAAVVAGGAAIGAGRGEQDSMAAPSPDLDQKILNFYLQLEYVQEALYRAAVGSGKLSGELLHFAAAAREQETRHVAFLTSRLGEGAAARPRTHFDHVLKSPEAFRDAAVELEEAALAGYIGQGANLTRDTMRAGATLISVEARQAAWIRDLAGVSPAPRAADQARGAEDVLGFLRERGYVA